MYLKNYMGNLFRKIALSEVLLYLCTSFECRMNDTLHDDEHMNDILQVLFKYLDAESLQNAELTCKAWKAAASDVNHQKLWQVLLHKKVRLPV
jgi:F-box-like